MTEFPLALEVPMERILLHELTHRINNEFSSLIGAVSRSEGGRIRFDLNNLRRWVKSLSALRIQSLLFRLSAQG